MSEIKSIRHAEVGGKRVLLRVDYNVPIENGKVMDDSRMRATLSTVSLLRDRGAAKIILLTHLGRPQGKVVEGLRTAQIFEHLKTLTTTTNLEMFENVRFDPREEANDEAFAKELARLGDVYVNEAFSNSHRAHASMVGVARLLPAYSGLQLEREIENLSQALTPPQGAVALIAATKEDKLLLVKKLAARYAKVFVGGPVPTTYTPPAANVEAPTDGIPQLEGLLDIGPQTRSAWVEEVTKSSFVLWNGPLGWYEKGYRESTDAVAQAIIANDRQAVIGGGDTVAALKKFVFNPEKVFLSTGGGAMLQFLIDGTLPALEALRD